MNEMSSIKRTQCYQRKRRYCEHCEDFVAYSTWRDHQRFLREVKSTTCTGSVLPVGLGPNAESSGSQGSLPYVTESEVQPATVTSEGSACESDTDDENTQDRE